MPHRLELGVDRHYPAKTVKENKRPANLATNNWVHNQMKKYALLALLVSGTLGFTGPVSASDIYKYRAADGTILFTDQPQERVGRDHTLLSVRKGWSYSPRALTAQERDRYDSVISLAATQFDVEPALIKAVIHAESLFDPKAVSRVGAQGLMQLMPETATYLNVSNPFDARQNILGGTRFLAYLKGKFNRLDEILAAYNAGEGNVRRYGGIPPFQETQAYVRKVKQLKQRYAAHFVAAMGDEKVYASR